MNQHIGKILPIEGYTVVFQGDVSLSYIQSLTHLYQPLIGAKAVSLYQTLLSEAQLVSAPQTHHTLMNYISLPLDELYEARIKLEGIGLLNTYKQDTAENSMYVYQLLAPFTPMEFFEDGMLSQLLYHHLGEKKYQTVVTTFSHKYPNVSIEGLDVTANFNDVFDMATRFQTVKNGASLTSEHQNAPVRKGPTISSQGIDFDWIEQMLQQRMLPISILTMNNKKLMEQMVSLYDLTNQEIEKALLWAISDENTFDPSEFKAACLDLFQSKQTQPQAKLVNTKDKITDQSDQSKSKQPGNKEDQFIQLLEQISPKQLLEDLSGGHQASAQDLKVIGDVMSKQGLTPGVMNVLVHYVLLKTDMKLTKSYMEKIASHWARKNVKTVRQAMTLAKSEHKKYQQWGNSKQSYYKKPGKKEVIPDWFHERDKTNQPKSDRSQQQPDQAKQKDDNQDVAELLENYIKNKKTNR